MHPTHASPDPRRISERHSDVQRLVYVYSFLIVPKLAISHDEIPPRPLHDNAIIRAPLRRASIMSSIGPQLPAELTKRKRSPGQDDTHSAATPPVKQARHHPAQQQATNNNEISLSDSDDDGPEPPATIGAVRPP
ncbi:hypothetical protein E4U42_006959, partial [Claviceps africana]